MIKTYFRPADLRDAMMLIAENPEALWLAGGTQVNRAYLDRKQPPAVIDIRSAVPAGVSREGTDTVIGAMTSLQEIADSELVPEALRRAAGFIPTRNVRNQATIGGNIGAGRADSYMIPALIALAAVARTTDGNLPVEDYVGYGHRELILDIQIPPPVGALVVVKESRSHLALPVVSAAVSLTVDEGLPNYGLSGACLAVGCVAPKTVRLTAVEQAIVSGALKTRADVETAVRGAISPETDFLGSAEYKKYINGVVIADAVIRCLEALV
jgi:putative selenate reductase FAD-binding subunit